MQKLAVALIQIALVVVAFQSMACSGVRVIKRSAPQAVDPDVALRERLRDLQAKGPLHFESDTDTLTGPSKDVLKEVAQQMFAHPRTRVIVTGHADERGDTAYNLSLGERRGNAARAYLTKLGVPPGRVRVVSLGEEQPLGTGHDEAAWAENRRDEFTFLLPSRVANGAYTADEPILVARVAYD
ncbi:MAG: OmpA family protein [Deltaproteobacteria bacterium]|nr:OmpA family protein [Deltaproteobacteria bacterium]